MPIFGFSSNKENGHGRSSAEMPARGGGSLEIPRGGSGGRASLELPQRRGMDANLTPQMAPQNVPMGVPVMDPRTGRASVELPRGGSGGRASVEVQRPSRASIEAPKGGGRTSLDLPNRSAPEGGPIKTEKRSLFGFMKKDSWWPRELLAEKGEVLGVGKFAEVYHSISADTGRDVAVKVMKVKSSDHALQKQINREIDILREVGNHPNVVRLIDTFRTDDRVGLIMERCYGGELFSVLENSHINGRGERLYLNKNKGAAQKTIILSEASIATILGQVLDVVQFLHQRGIVHRDLKLENILLERPFGSVEGGALKIKMIDFGLSKRLTDEGGMFEPCGSAYYAAPEVMTAKTTGKPYGTSADMWSVGVIAFCLLCLEFPFDGNGTGAVLAAARKGEFSYLPSISLSEDAKDFVNKCLVVNPAGRLTVDMALGHRWLRGGRSNRF